MHQTISRLIYCASEDKIDDIEHDGEEETSRADGGGKHNASAFAPAAWRRPSGNNIIMSHLVDNISVAAMMILKSSSTLKSPRLKG